MKSSDMQIDADWLRKRTAIDPDNECCEAGSTDSGSPEPEWEKQELANAARECWTLHRAFVDCPYDDGPLDLRIEDDDESVVHWEIIRDDFGDIERGTADTVEQAKAIIEAALPRVLREIREERAAADSSQCEHVWEHDIRPLSNKSNRCTLCGVEKGQ
jgi:hypothetical protein